MTGIINTQAWKKQLEGTLPGEKGHLRMATGFKGKFHHDREPLPAAVMILLYPAENNRSGLVLIKRNTYDGPHSAQVSLPGGVREKDDPSLAATAVRETREELGINEELEILGQLSKLYIPVSNFLVSPFVGHCTARPRFRPDPLEVDYLIETTLEHLLEPGNRDEEIIYHHGQEFNAPFYRVCREKVWGATAMILAEFLQLAASLPVHQR